MSLEQEIYREAFRLGFDLCGITDASGFPRLAQLLAARKRKGLRAEFEPGESDTRTEPGKWLDGAKSVIVVGYCYDKVSDPEQPSNTGVARFARAKDYHLTVSEKLTLLHQWLEQQLGHPVDAYCAVDSKPPLERALAKRAGLGWYGKNCSLINPNKGSFFVLGELVVTIDLVPDQKRVKDNCGRCRACLVDCPTGALEAPRRLNYRKCLSYWTQARGFIPPEIRPLLGTRIYGCDTCQEVCPHNQGRISSGSAQQNASEIAEILTMTTQDFKRRWRLTAAGWRGKKILQRNALVAAGNLKDSSVVPLILPFLHEKGTELRAHAAWALGQIGNQAAQSALLEALQREEEAQVIREITAALSSCSGWLVGQLER